jgi:hypothetical protein
MSLVVSTGPSRGGSQRSLLVSVGTTFRTDTMYFGSHFTLEDEPRRRGWHISNFKPSLIRELFTLNL